jgi:hypothetical protein
MEAAIHTLDKLRSLEQLYRQSFRSEVIDLAIDKERGRNNLTSHPSGSRLVCFSHSLKHGPWSNSRTPENQRFHVVSN